LFNQSDIELYANLALLLTKAKYTDSYSINKSEFQYEDKYFSYYIYNS
jgi:hypothetical protein